MNNRLSNEEIHEIVQRVVSQTLGGYPPDRKTVQPAVVEKGAANVPSSQRVVAIGTDHGGLALKEILKQELLNQGYQVVDCGTNTTESVDYPDIALSVAELVVSGEAWRGVVIDGAGIGSCMAANKVPGVRAALCYDYATAVNSREHNDANVLSLGAGLIGTSLAKQILNIWLTTEFSGGRHAKRVDKLRVIERIFREDGKKA